MKTILVILALLAIGWVLIKVVYPLLWRLFKLLMAVLIPGVIIIGIGLVLFVGAAAFSGMTSTPTEDGGPSLEERYGVVENINNGIEDKIDSMEGGVIDTWIKKKQKQFNEKNQ